MPKWSCRCWGVHRQCGTHAWFFSVSVAGRLRLYPRNSALARPARCYLLFHLIAREAIELYLDKLADGGIPAFNTSNRYLDLQPVLGNLMRDMGLVGLARKDRKIDEAKSKSGKPPSDRLVLMRQKEELAKLAQDPRWELLPGRSEAAVWTNDFSNIINVFKW